MTYKTKIKHKKHRPYESKIRHKKEQEEDEEEWIAWDYDTLKY